MEKYEIIKRLRVYMDEANGEGAWKPYIGSQLEADFANFIITEALHQPPVVGRSEQLVCPHCKGLEVYIDEYGGKPCICTKQVN